MAVLSRLRVACTPLTRLRLVRLSGSRAYGSAAPLRCYYDDDDDEVREGERWPEENPAMEDSEGSVSGRGVQWVVMGDPMAKRHVFAERLSQLLQVPRISMGTLVRQELHPHSSLYEQIANAVNQRKLVPEEVIFSLLSKRMEEGYCRGETGFILEGIPRTRIQAEILDQLADIDLVLNFKRDEDCLLKQQIGLHGYSSCREFHSTGSNSKLQFHLHPSDDQIEPLGAESSGALEKKLRSHSELSKPVEEYYKKQRKLIDFQVAGAPGETWQGLLATLHLQHMSAARSSQKLTA